MYCKRLFISLSLLSLFAPCVVHSAPTELTKYQKAVTQYEAGKYYKAAQLFEEALPQLRGKKEEASAHFYWAYCGFHQKKYIQSAKRFQYFRKTFLLDPRLEEALYMQAQALYRESPDVRLDQKFTQEASYVLRNYLQSYPEGVYAEAARTQLEALRSKLALKDFRSAQLYYQLGYYRAAVVTLENFQQDFSGSAYHEKVAYLKAVAQYYYYRSAKKAKKKESLSTAIMYCQDFIDSYPDSPYTTAIEKIYSKLTIANQFAP